MNRILAALAVPVFALSAEAQCELQKIITSDWNVGDALGVPTLIQGDELFAGTPLDDDGAVDSGSLYIFEWSGEGWVEQQKLGAENPGIEDIFSVDAAVDGDRLAVGAPGRNGDLGAVYVFDRTPGTTSWSQTAEITGLDVTTEDSFGVRVDLQGDTLVVGAPTATVGSGAVYVFVREAGIWTQQAKLSASDAAQEDQFGTSLVLFDDTLCIGAPLDDSNIGVDVGAAYVFERTGSVWKQTQKLLAGDGGASQDAFGLEMAHDDGVLAITAPLDDGVDLFTGSVYLFENVAGSWESQTKVFASDGEFIDQFGFYVKLDGERMLVGAGTDDHVEVDAGSAYLFERIRGTWTEVAHLMSPDSGEGDVYGGRLDLEGDRIVIAAPLHDLPNPDVGALYVYDASALGGSMAENYCIAVVNSSGEPASIGAQGSLSIANNDTTLFANSHIGFTPGLFFYGGAPAQMPFGEGYLCISFFNPGIFRLGTPSLSQFSGNAFAAVDFENLAQDGQIEGGSTWYFQYWYRDPNGGGEGFNLTDGLAVTFCP